MKLTEKLINLYKVAEVKEETKNEAVNVKEIIKELIDTSFSGDNASQMKAVQLLKGLATSDDPESNAFMKKLDTFTSGLKVDESNDVDEDFRSSAKELVKAFAMWKKDAPSNFAHITDKLEPLLGKSGAIKSVK